MCIKHLFKFVCVFDTNFDLTVRYNFFALLLVHVRIVNTVNLFSCVLISLILDFFFNAFSCSTG